MPISGNFKIKSAISCWDAIISLEYFECLLFLVPDAISWRNLGTMCKFTLFDFVYCI
jgi:hypothetical protein